MKIVSLGGGTGLSNILTGLKKEYKKKIKSLTAIVTVADSGGSSGILRKIYNIPAVGDLRNCLISLSNIENYLKKAMQYRFSKGILKGHPLGNLFLLALTETEGNILKAVKKASKILNVVGEIIPSTFDKVELIAKFDDGKVISGEEEITNYGLWSGSKILTLKIKPEKARVPQEAIKRILEADIILFGPGSLYTSILPNVLLLKIKKAIEKSKALKVFIVNILTQPGETDNFKASDHLKEFLRISKISKIDVALLNNKKPKRNLMKKIIEENKKIVEADVEEIEKMGIKVYVEDLLNEKDIYVKHDPDKLKKAILKIAKDFGKI